MSFGGGSGGGTQARVDPYAPAQPALNQILSENRIFHYIFWYIFICIKYIFKYSSINN